MNRLQHRVWIIFQRQNALALWTCFVGYLDERTVVSKTADAKIHPKLAADCSPLLSGCWLLALCPSGSRVRHFSHQWSISEISWTLKPFTISPLFCSLFHYVVVWTATTLLLSSPVKAAESKMSTTQTISFLKRLLFSPYYSRRTLLLSFYYGLLFVGCNLFVLMLF